MTWRSNHPSIHRSRHRSIPVFESASRDLEKKLSHWEVSVPPFPNGSYYISPAGKIFKSFSTHRALLAAAGVTDSHGATDELLPDELGFVRVFYPKYPSFDVLRKPTSAQLEVMSDMIDYYREYTHLQIPSILTVVTPFRPSKEYYEISDLKKGLNL